MEEFANKTALRKYYAHDFEAFAGALVNKKKLKEGYDPHEARTEGKLQQEFNASMEKLVGTDGRPAPVTSLKEGDEVQVYFEAAARHFGIKIEETIIEK